MVPRTNRRMSIVPEYDPPEIEQIDYREVNQPTKGECRMNTKNKTLFVEKLMKASIAVDDCIDFVLRTECNPNINTISNLRRSSKNLISLALEMTRTQNEGESNGN